MQGANDTFTDLLAERRKDCDILWVSRSMKPLAPHLLPPEAVYTRKQAIEAALNNPQVISAIESVAMEKGISKSAVRKEAESMLEEMASKDHLPTVRWLGWVITKFLKRVLISVVINEQYLLKLKGQMHNGEVQYVYAPTHRSYLDFVLLSYILFSYEMSLPNIASGMDFYRMRVVGELLRKTGAFYMRRSFSTDQLYKEIFKAYVTSIVSHSEKAIEFFIEGTRSRSQKSLSPKFGLLAMILESLYRGDVPDIQFIPMSVTYDRPLEESLFAYELLGVPKPKESTSGLFKSLSLLSESYTHGHVYFNIAEPISAREFLDSKILKESALTPNCKLPSEVVKKIAYSIVNSQKQHTVLTTFNIIAVLFNERIHTAPREPYLLNTLVADYRWLKNVMIYLFGAQIRPKITNPKREWINCTEEDEIMESLYTHKDLLSFDTRGQLKLNPRHQEVAGNPQKLSVRGHELDAQTMRLAVPVINLSIYVNPITAFVIKPAIIVKTLDGGVSISKDEAIRRYQLLRSLLAAEFALEPDINEAMLNDEWTEASMLLSKEDCLCIRDNQITLGRNVKFYSILRNILLPFTDGLLIVCTTLLNWNNATMGFPEEKQMLKECQKRAEKLIFNDASKIKHPYSLSLDLYSSTLAGLVATKVLVTSGKPVVYHIDKVQLDIFINDLSSIIESNVSGSYLDVPDIYQPELHQIIAKL